MLNQRSAAMRRSILFGLVSWAIVTSSNRALTQPSVVTIAADKSDQGVAEITKGQTLHVRFPVQMGTGYSWGVTQPSDAVRLVNTKLIERGRDTIPGGPETQLFVFEPVEAGASDIQFGYRRPWEKSTNPERTFILHVKVRPEPAPSPAK